MDSLMSRLLDYILYPAHLAFSRKVSMFGEHVWYTINEPVTSIGLALLIGTLMLWMYFKDHPASLIIPLYLIFAPMYISSNKLPHSESEARTILAQKLISTGVVFGGEDSLALWSDSFAKTSGIPEFNNYHTLGMKRQK